MPASSQSKFKDALHRGRVKPSFSDEAYLSHLEANSEVGEVQEIIREGIQRGLIRVTPVPGSPDRVRISRAQPNPNPPHQV